MSAGFHLENGLYVDERTSNIRKVDLGFEQVSVLFLSCLAQVGIVFSDTTGALTRTYMPCIVSSTMALLLWRPVCGFQILDMTTNDIVGILIAMELLTPSIETRDVRVDSWSRRQTDNAPPDTRHECNNRPRPSPVTASPDRSQLLQRPIESRRAV
ncbi:hypothetical protein BD309DRAFT_968221 [Dichomitus squalens]|nr:hypothetical protein BD309DRAFT_968221 [Dichomitus squalens]